MPNRRLDATEIARLNVLQARAVAGLDEIAGGDPQLLFALRRRLLTRLIHLERGTPAERKRLKVEKWRSQGGLCAICGLTMALDGSELDRAEAWKGYVPENTRLVHHDCHVEDQRRKGFSDDGAAGANRVERPAEMEVRPKQGGGEPMSQRAMMLQLYREYGERRELVCGLYVEAERAGIVVRNRNQNEVEPGDYARRLWADGKAKRWLKVEV